MRQVRRKGALRRQRAQRRGRVAEWLCLWHLRLRGWHILARGWRCPAGEIDILARRGKVLAVIEVKSRAELATAAMALAPRQRRRIARAAEAFLLRRYACRVIGVAPGASTTSESLGLEDMRAPGPARHWTKRASIRQWLGESFLSRG